MFQPTGSTNPWRETRSWYKRYCRRTKGRWKRREVEGRAEKSRWESFYRANEWTCSWSILPIDEPTPNPYLLLSLSMLCPFNSDRLIWYFTLLIKRSPDFDRLFRFIFQPGLVFLGKEIYNCAFGDDDGTAKLSKLLYVGFWGGICWHRLGQIFIRGEY